MHSSFDILPQAYFELIASEATYVNRLETLFEVFYNSKEFSSFETAVAIISKEDKAKLFLNIDSILEMCRR